MGSGAFLVEACRQLGKLLTESWRHHGGRQETPPGQDEEIFARRLVARRCLYGVDRNPIAVDLAKLSLWLATLSRDQPLTFVDHALRAGDSLVGLSRKQIARFHWLPDAEPIQQGFEATVVGDRVRRVAELRHRIQNAGPDTPDSQLRDWEREAREAAAEVTLYGDLALSAFFDGDRPAARKTKRRDLAHAVLAGTAADFRPLLEGRRTTDPPFAPLHWAVEFPEVFDRQNAGFDAIVGNPPFLGGTRISTILGPAYRDWLKSAHAPSHGNGDLVAHFFRRAFRLLRDEGALGLIATNTIAQGDTRGTGLRWICENGGTIFAARRRAPWPGPAAVLVSVVHILKGSLCARPMLDRQTVSEITAFLFHQGGHQDPVRLRANAGRSFIGSKIYGQGFLFDDSDPDASAGTLAAMRSLIRRDATNRRVIFPYLGGKEVNSSPTHAHHRYAINFFDWPLKRADIGELWQDADSRRRRWLRRQTTVPRDYPDSVAEDWPELLTIVQNRVKVARAHLTKNAIGRRRAALWWRYGSAAGELYSAISGLRRVLATCQTAQHRAFTFLPPNLLYSHKVIVFSLDSDSAFCSLQARTHEIWASQFGSTLGAGPVYTPSDCFENFPFSDGWTTDPDLEAPGREYHRARARLMIDTNSGLTTVYNRFHDPDDADAVIARLRYLHEAMDGAVLNAYGWTDIPTTCDFFLDHEDDEEDEQARPNRRRKPWRYRWPDDVRDEVLSRLLALNAARAAEEEEARRTTAGLP